MSKRFRKSSATKTELFKGKHRFEHWYRVIGYLKTGENLGPMMQHFHGSVGKLVDDTLDIRLLPFWRTAGNQDYFDGCLRDEKQANRAYRYTLKQSVRHGIVRDWRDYPHTHVNIEMDRATKRAPALKAFLYDVPYARYQRTSRFSDQAPRQHP